MTMNPITKVHRCALDDGTMDTTSPRREALAMLIAADLDGLCVWIRMDGQPDKLVQVDSVAINGDTIQLEVCGGDA